MTIYVDDAFTEAKVGKYTTSWCHLVTDSGDLEELHRFAESIGLERSYFQDPRYSPGDQGRPHYDVTPGARKRAVAAGAEEISAVDTHSVIDRHHAAARERGGEQL